MLECFICLHDCIVLLLVVIDLCVFLRGPEDWLEQRYVASQTCSRAPKVGQDIIV